MTDALGYAVLAAGANLAGAAAVAVRRRWSDLSLELLTALSAGFMISVALVDMVPDAIVQGGEGAAVAVLLGFMIVHLTQHAFVGHFHFGHETHVVTARVSASALVGLLLHTFIDGVAIASAFTVSRGLGLLVFGAIFLHKFPEGLAISSLTLAAGGSRKAAVGSAALLAAATVVGVLTTSAIAPLAQYGLALSGGVTLYVGASNLVPEFQGKSGWAHSLAFFGGAAMYFLARAVAAFGV